MPCLYPRTEKNTHIPFFKKKCLFLIMYIWGDMHPSDLGHQNTISDPLKLVFEVVVKAAPCRH